MVSVIGDLFFGVPGCHWETKTSPRVWKWLQDDWWNRYKNAGSDGGCTSWSRHVWRLLYNPSFLVGVRDYIHVVDLAKGHTAALKKLKDNCGCKVEFLLSKSGANLWSQWIISMFLCTVKKKKQKACLHQNHLWKSRGSFNLVHV